MKLLYRPEIDGLRGLAVLSVLLFHINHSFLKGGFLGVDIFFVISGYLISNIILSQIKNNSFNLFNFFVRRIKRLYPALFITVLITLVLSFFISPFYFKDIGLEIGSSFLFLSNFLFWDRSGYFGDSHFVKPLLHLWSLSIEGQFYLLSPFIFLLFFKKYNFLKTIFLVLFLISIFLCIKESFINQNNVFFLTYYRIYELIFGVMIAIYTFDKNVKSNVFIPLIGIAIILFCLIFKINNTNIVFWIIPTILGTGLILVSTDDNLVNKFLKNKSLVYVGIISYPLYLTHWVYLSFFRMYFENENISKFLIVIVIPISFISSILIYKFLEKPIRSSFFNSRRIVSVSIILTLFFVSIGFTIYKTNGLIFRYDKNIRYLASLKYGTEEGNDKSCIGENIDQIEKLIKICNTKQTKNTENIFLWGSSFAAHLFPGLNSVLPKDKFSITRFALSSCPPINKQNKLHPYFCKKGFEIALNWIKQNKPEYIIVSHKWGDKINGKLDSFIFVNEIIPKIKEIYSNNKIIIVGNPISWPFKIPNHLITKQLKYPHLKLPERSTSWHQINYDKEEYAFLNNNSNFYYFSPVKYLCDNNNCLMNKIINNQIFPISYKVHLTNFGSKFIMKHLYYDYFSKIIK